MGKSCRLSTVWSGNYIGIQGTLESAIQVNILATMHSSKMLQIVITVDAVTLVFVRDSDTILQSPNFCGTDPTSPHLQSSW